MGGPIKNRLLELLSNLPILGQLTIPRFHFDFPVDKIELPIIGDSSVDIF